MFQNSLNSRIDYILIWGNGMKFKDDIIQRVQAHPDFKILHMCHHRATSIQNLVLAIYSFDYAPFEHLRNKTAYLLTTCPDVFFIFFENSNTQEDFLGTGSFRHIESLTLKKFKESLRDQFNERLQDRRSENHVIHASDNQEQTDYILKYLGYRGIDHFIPSHSILDAPFHLSKISNFNVKKIQFKDILCTILDNDSPDRKRLVHLNETPHYRTLKFQDNTYYMEYLNRFQGRFLKDDYSVQKFLKLAESFEYLDVDYETNYVIVRSDECGSYIIMDGLHRAAIIYWKGYQNLIVAEVV